MARRNNQAKPTGAAQANAAEDAKAAMVEAKAPAAAEPETSPTPAPNETPEVTEPETPAETNEPEAKSPKGVSIEVRTKRGVTKFRRAGFSFSREPTVLNVDDLSEAQIQALANEPRLMITPQDSEA